MRTQVAIFGLISLTAITLLAVGCVDREGTETDTGAWTVPSDTGPAGSEDGAEEDSGDEACPAGTNYDPVTGECVDPMRDTGGAEDTGTYETWAADTGTTVDSGPSETEAGQTFEGPELEGRSEHLIEVDHGLGLYWKSALSQFGDQTQHKLLKDQSIMDLSRLTTRTQTKTFRARLPKKPSEQYHFFRRFCDEVGEEECEQRGIDDETATFALLMLGLHEAPESGKASDCTWEHVYGKRHCDYGRVVAPSRIVIVYAYRSFEASDYRVFDNICVADDASFAPGYSAIHVPRDVSEGCSGDARVLPFPYYPDREQIRASSDTTFPMLYP